MCIIAIKKAGVKMPGADAITTMWTNNPDGAGFMYVDDGKVRIEKGFMHLNELLERLDRLSGCIDTTATPFVMHFRITTHGGTSPENCHPFPISNNVAILQKTLGYTDVGVAHNGIINIRPRAKISDTMEYIVSQLAYIKRINRRFYTDENCLALIENAIASKMAFLAGNGTIATIGKFEEHNGMIYSNGSYEPRLSYGIYDTSLTDDYVYSYTSKDGGKVYKFKGAATKGAEVKPLMLLLDNKSLELTVKQDKTGELHDIFDYAVDAKMHLYGIDWDSGCAYRVYGYSVLGNVVYEKTMASNYECYATYDGLLTAYYGLSKKDRPF